MVFVHRHPKKLPDIVMSSYPAKLGIVAGGGDLPQKLISFCESKRIETFVVGLEGHANLSSVHEMVRIGKAGQIIKLFKDKGYKDLVIIGSVKRPKFSEMKPDVRTALFFTKLGFRALGDDGLLKAVRKELEGDGFTLRAIQDLMDDLLMPVGSLGSVKTSETQYEDIHIGLSEARAIGTQDLGQSVVVLNEQILGVEDEYGTNALITRVAQKGAILVKSSKPQQDRTLDMPTLGPETIRLCAQMGYAGIAAEAEGVLLVDRDEMIKAANEAQIFLVGV